MAEQGEKGKGKSKMDEYKLASYWRKLWQESNGQDITAPAKEVCMTIDALIQLSAMLDAERAENVKLREEISELTAKLNMVRLAVGDASNART